MLGNTIFLLNIVIMLLYYVLRLYVRVHIVRFVKNRFRGVLSETSTLVARTKRLYVSVRACRRVYAGLS